MPIYEFRCRDCNRVSSELIKLNAADMPACPTCGSRRMERLLSRFAYHKSTATVWEESGTPGSGNPDYYKDPRNIGRWAEKKLGDMGMDVPAPIKEKIQAAREGELPRELKG